MIPFEVRIDLKSGILNKSDRRSKRYLSDLNSYFIDTKKIESMIRKKNVLVYEVYEIVVPEELGHMMFGSSILYPGKVGSEYFLTKGHYHEKIETAEIYFCLKGEGYLVMESLEGEFLNIYMRSGSIAYVPPKWAHRTTNTGTEPFVCFYSVPATAGHDYDEIEKNGFKTTIIESEGKVKIIKKEDY